LFVVTCCYGTGIIPIETLEEEEEEEERGGGLALGLVVGGWW
jgi:hypothetical protein